MDYFLLHATHGEARDWLGKVLGGLGTLVAEGGAQEAFIERVGELRPGLVFLHFSPELAGASARLGEQLLRLFPGLPGPVTETRLRMPSVKVRENEPFEFALRRFKRTCEKAGVLAETRKREFYEKPTQERKRKAAAAVKRQARRASRDVTKRQRLY